MEHEENETPSDEEHEPEHGGEKDQDEVDLEELLAELDKYRKKPKSFQFNEAQKRFVRLARQHQYPISKRNLFPIFVEKFEVDLSRRIFEGLVTEMEIKK